MNAPQNKGRRRFLIATGVVGGGLAVGSWWFYRERNLMPAPDALFANEGEAILNAWLKIDVDGRVIVQVPRQEMGQGIATALPMLVAEELDVDFADVSFEQAPIAPVYGNAVMFADGVPFRPEDHSWIAEFSRLTQFKAGRALGIQTTGGSSSVRDAWTPMRQAGATARAMLLTAGAKRLGVAETQCTVKDSRVIHAKSERSVGFGELAMDAAALPLPSKVSLKKRSEFRLLGSSQPRLDIPSKVDGSAIFGLDAQPPGMIYAAIRQTPYFGGSVGRIDTHAAREMPGVRKVVELAATSTSDAAVAVIADHYWQAKKALDKVGIEWQPGEYGGHDTDEQRARFMRLLESEDGRTYDSAGDIEPTFAQATKTIEANYFAPYLAHATMEPINCTTVIRSDGSADIWVGNQAPTVVRAIIAKATNIDSENINVHTPYLGGGFGRRAEMDVIMQSAQIADVMRDTPVQLIWSREQDIQHNPYRPMGMAQMRAAIGDDGELQGFASKVVGQSPMYSLVSRQLPGMESNLMKDRTTAEGIFDLPYGIQNRRVNQIIAEEPIPVGFWRSVGHSHNAFFAEAFIDECAEAAGKDAYEFRHQLLDHAPRYQKVLVAAAEAAKWGSPTQHGRSRGIALAESFGSIVAQVAEVSLVEGRVRVHRVTCAIDCGFAVNPDTVVQQMESGIIFGLTAALFGEITVKAGKVQQSNFPNYPMLLMGDSPEIDVHVIESGVEHLGGIGEPGTPPIAPAVANALYKLTGKRIRELPIRV